MVKQALGVAGAGGAGGAGGETNPAGCDGPLPETAAGEWAPTSRVTTRYPLECNGSRRSWFTVGSNNGIGLSGLISILESLTSLTQPDENGDISLFYSPTSRDGKQARQPSLARCR